MGVKDVQFISDKQWLAGIRDIIELHKYGRADEVRTVHRLASTCEERYQKALEYLEGKRGQQGKPAGAREGRRTAGGTGWSKQGGERREDSRGNQLEQARGEGRREDGRGNLLAQGRGRKERGQQGKPAGASKGGRKEGGQQGEPAGASGGKERGEQGDLVFTTFGSAEGGHARKYSNKFGISLTYP